MKYLIIFAICVCSVPIATGTLQNVFMKCCHLGVTWVDESYRCDNYLGPVANISDNDQAACLSVIQICCMKQMQVMACEVGKQTALEGQICATRDSDPGAEQFRECCHCCRLGVETQAVEPSCKVPGLGEPCDTKFEECCKGEKTSNTTFAVVNPDQSDGPDDENDEKEDEVEGCTSFRENPCSHFCVDVPEGFYCACPTDWSLNPANNRTCFPNPVIDGDSDENDGDDSGAPDKTHPCASLNVCEQKCVDKGNGAFECKCYQGYRLADDQRSCIDIDECVEGLGRCAPAQRCINTRGSFTCLSSRCPKGYTMNAVSGQCEFGDHQCEIGFAYDTVTGGCEDLNECGQGTDTCGIGERCENTIGSYTCQRLRHCGTGYTLDQASQSCRDNDECRLGTHNCGHGYKCQNTQGSFRCIPKPCETGYRFDRVRGICVEIQCPVGLVPNAIGSCVDVNECQEIGRSACKRHQRCINTRGSFYCRNTINCPDGYEVSERKGCVDIDECEKGTHKCGPEQQCINRQGNYFCQCPRGLRHDSFGRCIDVDECSYGAAICPTDSRCVNTIGSFKCDCQDGLISDGAESCADIDECDNVGICQQSCVNVLGTFFCACNRGYQLRDDKRSCEDINECTQFGGRGGRNGVCGGRCINLPGSYRCECTDGWRLKPDGKNCADINECKEGTSFCPNRDSICINTRGNYKCPLVRCPDGFIKTNSTVPNSIRCKRITTDCAECRRGLISQNFNFLSFASNVIIPAPLFSMTGSRLVDKFYTWDLELLSARPLAAGVKKATKKNFSLEKSRDFARVTLIKRIQGPQDLLLKLTMNVTSYYKGFEGTAESKIFLYVTEEDTS